ncbi:hypothetical protein I6A84_41780 [Frankia sp. CNm7]|uniref:Uncharacterized protein n=1 Tax=Frankia nepalensis TaxID=1836974 RepID=A0A937RJH2_9ACTN|nr:hypothetical protein [Frankia nepalensis]MBL7500814.1 hypothetical protein [Frankia nepalensis]MBL7514552.1 hypothetical protein [Frankia nepalensis]MBL7524399.1 hypothetical protein [Frankia nepalensis]MBL7631460.1 hypothetical protein [Frankia nepalensis]
MKIHKLDDQARRRPWSRGDGPAARGHGPRGQRGWTAVAGALGIGATVLLAACSDSSDLSGPPAGAGGPAVAPAEATEATEAACDAALASDWVNIPGINPSQPPASAAELAAWATPLQTQLATLRAGVPASLTSQIDALDGVVRDAKDGKQVPTEDASLGAALTAVNGWAYDSCGYTTLDVTNSDGSALSGVSTSLPAGPVALKFTNAGSDPAKAGFILLIGKVRDGETATAADVRAGTAVLQEVSDIVGVAQPVGSGPAYGLTTLGPGRYIVSTPVGTPPEFATILASDLEVS